MNTRHHIAPFWFELLLLALLAPALFAQAPSDGTFLPEGIEATGDTAEVRALHAWAYEHRRTDSEQARQVAERVLELAQDLDDQKGIGESLTVLGNIATYASELQQAEAYYITASEAFEHIGDERGLTRNQVHMGNVYMRRGDMEQALTFYFNALEGFEHLGDTEGQVGVLNNIGNVHQDQGNWEEATMYYEQAVTLVETLDEPDLLVMILIGFGSTLANYGSHEKAEVILRRALAISEERGSKYHAAYISNNLGALFNKQNRHEQALPHLLTAEQLGNELENNELLIPAYDELGKAYLGLGQYDHALDYANESLMLALEAGLNNRQMEAHQTLSHIYEASGDYEQALAHYRQYAATRDSVFNAEKTEIITEMLTRYEAEEKQRAIERLEYENRIRLILFLAGVSGLLLLLGFLYNRYRLNQKANRLLEELDTAKSRFFANISHEFRTPLTVILGGLKDALAGRFGKTTGKLTEQHQAMLRNTRQLQGLIEEVLDLNRLESGKLELHPAPGDLVRSLRRIVEADAPLAERNDIDLTFEPNAETCPRLYDQEKLEKIVGNLLSNALKFTPEGGSVRIALSCGKETEIVVSDSGPGIPTEMQEKVFERFAQVEDGSHHGGAGIGLALAKELTELHGGRITLESTPEEGSIFTVQLSLEETTLDDVQRTAPLRAAHRAAARQAQGALHSPAKPGGGIPTSKEELEVGGNGESPSPIGRGGRGEGLDRTTVLVIEDNADVRAFIRRSLKETYRILEAADGETGLQRARAELPDLIVSDIMLPGIDGYEVARRLKAEPATECIPVVMLTARAAEEDQTEGYGSGAEVYITKPFSPETLRAALARLLEERRRLRRLLREEAEKAVEDGQEADHTSFRHRVRTAAFEHLYDEDFGVEELATTLGMSRRTLHRRAKQELGLSPSDFVRTLRLERARELLAGGAGSISEVAYAVGFNSRVAFSRAYTAHYGMPPSEHHNRKKNVSG